MCDELGKDGAVAEAAAGVVAVAHSKQPQKRYLIKRGLKNYSLLQFNFFGEENVDK